MDKIARQKALLKAIVQEYVATAHPVSSKTLAQATDLDCSPATIRNDMAVLEQAGYIVQPHTSAGRIPTEKAYQFYIRNFLEDTELATAQKRLLEPQVNTAATQPGQLKTLAKAVSDMADQAVIVASDNAAFATGMSHVLRQPEFAQAAEAMLQLVEMMEQLDTVASQMRAGGAPRALIGQDNPLSSDCTLIVSRLPSSPNSQAVIGIFGPMRMDYNHNFAILNFISSLNHHSDE